MIVIGIISIIAILVIMAVTIVKMNSRKNERDKYYKAAGNIIREDYLNYCLVNTVGNEKVAPPNGQKIMIYIKSGSGRTKNQFVFDPEKRVNIGRDPESNNIFINEAAVSMHHCSIVSEGAEVYIYDLNSTNGTVLKRGLFRNINLSGGAGTELRTGDRVCVGSNIFKITLFYYDMVTM